MNYFLASVGEAEILTKKNGRLQSFASARALTESVINFNGTMEEVRGGNGARLLGRFSTNSSVEIQMTNVMFDLKEVAAQIGQELVSGGTIKKIDQGATIFNNDIATTEKISPLGDSCGLDKLMVWICYDDCKNSTFSKAYEVELVGEVSAQNIISETNYCGEDNFVGGQEKLVYRVKNDVLHIPEGVQAQVSYFTKSSEAMVSIVNSVFNPPEFVLILKAKLFAGDSKNIQKGSTEVGTVIIKIPRFQLNGQLDLTMSMSAASTVGLSGVALLTDANCHGEAEYAEIVEVVPNKVKLNNLIFENQDEGIELKDLISGEKIPTVYGIMSDGKVYEPKMKDLSFETNVEGLFISDEGLITNSATGDKTGYIRVTSKEHENVFAVIEII